MDIAGRTKQILCTRGLTLYRASKRSREIFGRGSPYYIPQNLYYQVSVNSIIPNIHQLFALSHISNYRLCDWLAAFGLHLDNIPRLEALLPRQRTTILDSTIYDEEAWVPWPAERSRRALAPSIAPLGQILGRGAPKRAKELLGQNPTRFLYVKLGRNDALAFPDLVPGSIARVDVRRATEIPKETEAGPSGEIFLTERASGLNCCRLRRESKDRIVLCSAGFPFAQVELTLGLEVRIRGVVDAEIRPLPGHPAAAAGLPAPAPRKHPAERISDSPASLGEMIRSSRIRAGVSFREASRTSRWISEILDDRKYFAATGTLSDYETLSTAPRHVQKILSLCILYSIGFFDFLRASGFLLDLLGVDPMPDELVPRYRILRRGESGANELSRESPETGIGFLPTLIEQWEEVPLFLKDVLSEISGLKHFSLSEVFWLGGDERPIHPWLANAIFAAVNRRFKKPVESTAKPLWQHPVYVILRRDGSYICGCCTLERESLVIHPFPDPPYSPRRLRNGIDAEVIGQVVTIVRRISRAAK